MHPVHVAVLADHYATANSQHKLVQGVDGAMADDIPGGFRAMSGRLIHHSTPGTMYKP